MEQNEKNSFDALMSLADFRLRRAFNRRDYEWKVTLGVWALFAAAIGHPLPREDTTAVIWIVMIICVAHILLWVRHHWDRSTIDLRMAFWFAEIAERKFSFHESPPAKVRPPEMDFCERYMLFLFQPACLAQILTTIVLGAAVIYRTKCGV
jgi:hypothetical protein